MSAIRRSTGTQKSCSLQGSPVCQQVPTLVGPHVELGELVAELLAETHHVNVEVDDHRALTVRVWGGAGPGEGRGGRWRGTA